MAVSSSFHATGNTHIHLCKYGTGYPPILTLSDGGTITVSMPEKLPVADHVHFAKELLAAATEYAAAAEVWAAAQTAAPTGSES